MKWATLSSKMRRKVSYVRLVSNIFMFLTYTLVFYFGITYTNQETFVHINTKQFKKGDIFFNYGCLPRTWEDPTFVHPDAEGCRGDNDPVDVCEIGARIVKTGVSLYLSCF